MKIKPIKLINVLLILSMMLGFVQTIPVMAKGITPQAGTTIDFSPATAAATTCEAIEVNVMVNNVVALTGYHLEMTFDHEKLQVVDVKNGGLLHDSTERAGLYEPVLDDGNTTGRLIWGMAQRGVGGDPSPVSGTGSLLKITLKALVSSGSDTLEIDSAKTMLVDWPDAFEIGYTVSGDAKISLASCAPTAIALDNSIVAENLAVPALVGNLSATDPDTGDTSFSYTLVENDDYPDNAAFSIVGDKLNTAAVFNYEVKNSYSIKIRATDTHGAYFEKVFTITVEDVNDAPVLALIGPKTVANTGTLNITPSASDEDVPAQTLEWSLGAGTASGATINPTTGAFSWTPGTTTAPGQYTAIICVTDGDATTCETVNITVTDGVSPIMENVSPARGNVYLAAGESFVLTVDASDDNLASLEVDHSFEGTLPEFTVYADKDNPWGDPASAAWAEREGVLLSYDEGDQVWTIDFGTAITETYFIPNGVTFHFVLKDEEGNTWGSMSPTTPDNTYAYTLVRDDVAPVMQEVTPERGNVYLAAGENFVLTVDASDTNLYSLEIDHSMEATLPEFKVYADEDDPYGGDKADFDTAGVTVLYDDSSQKWTIDFGPNLTNTFMNNPAGITFYMVLEDLAGNKWGSMYTVTPENTFAYKLIRDDVAPKLISVTPPHNSTVLLGIGDTFKLTIKAEDDNLRELEIDHSMELTLPEFSVYASEADPYGGDEALFVAKKVTVTYDAGTQTWVIDFGPIASEMIATNGGITFYMVLEDMAGNTWGSMSPTTTENTFKYIVSQDEVRPTISSVVAKGATGFPDVTAVGTTLTVDEGYKVSTIEITMSEPVAVALGTQVTINPQGAVYGTVTAVNGAVITVTPAVGNETASVVGTFTFTVPAGSVEDLAGNAWQNVPITLVVQDVTAPTIVSGKAFGATGFADVDMVGTTFSVPQGYTVDHIEFTMSEDVQIVAPGIVYHEGNPYGTMTASGNVVTVTPYSGNEVASIPGTFTFSIDAGSIVDMSGNALGTLTVTMEVEASPIFNITDFGPWGTTWPGAYNLGWGYVPLFDTMTIEKIEVGMLDADRKSIVSYSAEGEQIVWQRDHAYITAEKLSSAPFYRVNNGNPLAEGMDDDWTVIFGESFDAWSPRWGYVRVTDSYGTVVYREIEYTGTLGDLTAPEIDEAVAVGVDPFDDVTADNLTFTVPQGYTVEKIEFTMSEPVTVVAGTEVTLAGVPYGSITANGTLITVTPYAGNKVANLIGTFVFKVPTGKIFDLSGNRLGTLEATMIVTNVAPELEAVTPPKESSLVFGPGENFVMTVDAKDYNLYSLEVDHSMEGTLPEFTVYASATNPYGDEAAKALFEAQGVNVTYIATTQTWTIDFGAAVTKAIADNNGITFYLVLADESGSKWGSMNPTTPENTFTYTISQDLAPELESVLPVKDSSLLFGLGENFVLTVDAKDKNLYSLEVDHSLEGTLPEFTVYADPNNVYGSPEAEQAFVTAGVSVTYNAGTQTWIIDFGAAVTKTIADNNGITFYLVLADESGNKWGSMDPVTTENTFKYNVSQDLVRPTIASVVAKGGTGYLDVTAVGTTLTVDEGYKVSTIEITMTEPVAVAVGTQVKINPQGAVYGTVTAVNGDVITVTPAVGNETASVVGTFTFTVPEGSVEDLAGNAWLNAPITLVVQDVTAPVMESVLPLKGSSFLYGPGGKFVLTVDAKDDNLYSLEVDHSLEGILPEFTVYADAGNVYGSPEAAAAFAAKGVSVTYNATTQTWTIDFGAAVTKAIADNNGITFYLVLADESGNKWGSMDPVTTENTFTYTVAQDLIAPELIKVTPTKGSSLLFGPGENFILTVEAKDDNLYSLEVDHSMETTLPEFTVYASATNPYGDEATKALFEAQGVLVAYNAGTQTWTIDFGAAVTKAIADNNGITFYLVLADESGNKWGSMSPTTPDNTFAYTVAQDLVVPELVKVSPTKGSSLLFGPGENFVLTVEAKDDNLYSLEVDHSMETTLSEFTVYADAGNVYGSPEAAQAFATAGVSVTYNAITQTWTIDFGAAVTKEIADNGGITFYLVLADESGNKWGSMDPTTPANTFAYTIAQDLVAPTVSGATAIGATGFGNVDDIEMVITVDQGYTVAKTEISMSEAVTVVANTEVSLAGVPYGLLTVDTTGKILTATPYPGNEVASKVGEFIFEIPAGSVKDLKGNALETLSLKLIVNNVAPVAVADAYIINEDETLTVTAPGVLANDTDYPGTTLTAVWVSGPANGTVDLKADGSFVYTPNANFHGTDTFSYKANDGDLDSAAATVTITVNPVNDAPVAVNDAYATSFQKPLTVTAADGVLKNDSDVDGDDLTVKLVSDVNNGVLALAADGSFTYTPNTGFNGLDTFTYTANDGKLDSNTATVSITVSAFANTPPVAVDDEYETDENVELVVPVPGVLDNDYDIDGDNLTATLKTNVTNGTLVLLEDGSFTYKPNPGFCGTDSFVYTLVSYPRITAGDDGWTADATATITVYCDAKISSSDLDGPFYVGNLQEFHVRLENKAPGHVYGSLAASIFVDGISAADFSSVELKHPLNPTTWVPLTPAVDGSGMRIDLGPIATMPLISGFDQTLSFRVNFNTPGEYPVTGTLYDGAIDPTKVIATYSDTMVVAGLLAQDFGYMYQSDVLGVTAGFGNINFDLSQATEIKVELFTGSAPDYVLLQTNTAVDPDLMASWTQFSTPFDIFGSFDYAADGYWTNVRAAEYGQTAIPSRVLATITLPDGITLTAENTKLTGDRRYIIDTLDEELASAPGYDYDPEYPIVGDIDFDITSNTYTGTYTAPQVLAGGPMNDMARYLGALYRQASSTITSIVYGGKTYTWDSTGTLLGSNWEDSTGKTLVSQVTDDFQAAIAAGTWDPDKGFVMTVHDDYNHSANVTFKMIILNTLDDELESAPNYVYTPAYTYVGNWAFDDPTNIYTLTYDDTNFNPGAMNDLARYLGALHRQAGSTVASIEYDGVTYTWQVIGNELKGSNWRDVSGTTLMSVITADVIANKIDPSLGLILTLNDVFHTENVTFKLVVNDTTLPELEAVTPLKGSSFLYGPGGSFVLTVDAKDDNLYSLEVDHSMESTLPEFTVYADETDPYGGDKDDFDLAGVSVTYNPITQTWTIDFGPAITTQFANNGGITFYLVLADETGNKWGSMDPTTAENTFDYYITQDLVAPTVSGATAIGASGFGNVDAVEMVITVDQGYTVEKTEISMSEAVTVVANTKVSLAGVPYGLLTVDTTGKILTVIPYPGNEVASLVGEFNFTIPAGSVKDLAGNPLEILSLKLIVLNVAPVTVDDAYTVNEDETLTITALAGVLANDTDYPGTSLTAELVSGPTNGTLTLNPDGSFVYIPNANFHGSDSFTYKANDGELAGNTATVTITVNPVNDVPVAQDQTVTTPEDTAKEITLVATDADGDPLTYTVVAGPTKGTLSGTAPNLTYTPNANYNGTDSFTFKANDGKIDSNTATVSITVTAVNDSPVAEDQSVSTPEDTAKEITLVATDVDGDTLTYTVVAGPTNGSLSGTAPNLTYTPNANYSGTDTFTFKANDGTIDSNTATVTITVTAVNHAPVAQDQSVETAEDTAIEITLEATDVDGQSLTYSIVGQPAHGSLSLVAGNKVTYTPALNYNGADSFTFKANDGTIDSNIATVTISVTAVNDAPVAQNQTVTTPEDTAIAINLVATDVDNTTLTYSIVAGPTHGSLGTLSGNQVVYTPNKDYNGTDSFTFKANDGSVDSNIATVTININPVNDAPVAVDDSYTMVEDQILTIAAPGILANDSDDGTSLTAVLVDTVSHGKLTLNANGSFTYTPNEQFNGKDSFTYKASDGELESNLAVVEITVTPVNDWVIANDDAYETLLDETLVVEAEEGVLANDVLLDPDETVSIEIRRAPESGTLVMNNDGSFSFVPKQGFMGRVTFEYRVHSLQKAGEWFDDATVTILVKPHRAIYLPLMFVNR